MTQSPGAFPLPRSGTSAEAPIVFLHGLFETRAIWDGLLDRQGPLLPDHVSLPLPGHVPGHDARRTRWLLEHERFIHVYARFLRRRFGGRPVRLVGHSTGGLIALRLALAYPDLVADAFLVAALFSGRQIMQDRALARLLQLPVVGPISAMLVHRAALTRPREFQMWCATAQARGVTPRQVPDLMRLGLRICDPRSLAQLVVWLGTQSITDDLPRIAQPVTALVGAQDPVLPARHQLDLLGRLPNAQATLMDTGHLPFFESPGRFDRAFLGWRYGAVHAPRAQDAADTAMAQRPPLEPGE